METGLAQGKFSPTHEHLSPSCPQALPTHLATAEQLPWSLGCLGSREGPGYG